MPWIWWRGVITSSTVTWSSSNRLASSVRCLPRKYWPSSTSERTSSGVSVPAASAGGRMRSSLQHPLHEQVDEADDPRHRGLQERHQRVGDVRREAVGVRRADHLGRDLRDDQDRERDRDGARCQHPLLLAEEALGDDRGERRRRGVDQVVAEQDHAEQPVGPAEQRQRELRATLAARGAVLQAIAVRRHHRGLGEREQPGEHEQHREHGEERRDRDVVHDSGIRDQASGLGHRTDVRILRGAAGIADSADAIFCHRRQPRRSGYRCSSTSSTNLLPR